MTEFNKAPLAELQRFRSYSRMVNGKRETWDETCDRTLYSPHLGLKVLGKFTDEEIELIDKYQREKKAFGSMRWLWVGGTKWVSDPLNISGAYNCSSFRVIDWHSFGMLMDLAMQGCGTGGVLEKQCIDQLPTIINELRVEVVGEFGTKPSKEETEWYDDGNYTYIIVGDSRKGWVKAYQTLLEFASDDTWPEPDHAMKIVVDISRVRPAGTPLKGFGGVANPVKLPEMFKKIADILNGALGRKLNSLEVCLLLDEAATTVVAGNIRRCLPKEALVHTFKGLLPIEQVEVGYEVETPQGFRKVVNKFYQGEQVIYRVNTNGNPLFATAEHRVAVLSDTNGSYIWKKVKDLDAGDRLLHTTSTLDGVDGALPINTFTQRPAHSTTCREITIPLLTPDIAWLIGYTHGNGYVATGRNKHGKPFGFVTWSMSSKSSIRNALIEKIAKALAHFDLSCNPSDVKGENTTVVGCRSIQLAEYFMKHVKQPKTSMVIPDWILTSSPDSRAAYLAGLMDSDGAINNRPVVLVSSIYPDYLRQVAALYSSLGIATRLKLNRAAIGTWKEVYHLTLPAFKVTYNDLIAPHSVKGKVKIGNRSCGFSVPSYLTKSEYTWTSYNKHGFSYFVDTNYESFREKIGSLDQIPITVVSVEPDIDKATSNVRVCETYDIEVEEQNCFFVEGILVHNSASMRQGSSDDEVFAAAKENLWQQDENGNWRIDPKRDALRMANHTRVFHHKPTLEECIESVTKQFWSGEGAIQWAGEAIARANADLLDTPEKKGRFLQHYSNSKHSAAGYLEGLSLNTISQTELDHRLSRYGLNPCGEIIFNDGFCNLSSVHLNQLDPFDHNEQKEAFTASALQAAAFLQHGFVDPRQQESRELDPIVGVSFTGAFTFFVKAFGPEWLKWWEQGRPDTHIGLKFKNAEQEYLTFWKDIVHQTVWDYCDRHGLKRPNRCTTGKPEGSGSLLTGVGCNGFHPPKDWRYIRRITFAKDDPIARAAIDYGYNVVPSQSDKDENGVLLNDPFDPRCTEWLVEVPVEEEIIHLFPEVESINPSKFSALAQFSWYMQMQRYYARHNVSATLEFTEDEIEPLANRIYDAIQNDEGYISAALLARFEANETFPRLPFEPVSKEKYDALVEEVKARRKSDDFQALVEKYTTGVTAEPQDSACGDGFCAVSGKEVKDRPKTNIFEMVSDLVEALENQLENKP